MVTRVLNMRCNRKAINECDAKNFNVLGVSNLCFRRPQNLFRHS